MTGGQLEYMASCDHRSACERHVTMHASLEADSYSWCLCATCPWHESESAKLRELARRFAEYVSQDRCEGCVMKRRCNNGDVEECWQLTKIRELARECGIEVDA